MEHAEGVLDGNERAARPWGLQYRHNSTHLPLRKVNYCVYTRTLHTAWLQGVYKQTTAKINNILPRDWQFSSISEVVKGLTNKRKVSDNRPANMT